MERGGEREEGGGEEELKSHNKATIPGPWRASAGLSGLWELQALQLLLWESSRNNAASSPELHTKHDTFFISRNPTTPLVPPLYRGGGLNLREGGPYPGSHHREGSPGTCPWCVWLHSPVDTEQPAGLAVDDGSSCVRAFSRMPSQPLGQSPLPEFSSFGLLRCY